MKATRSARDGPAATEGQRVRELKKKHGIGADRENGGRQRQKDDGAPFGTDSDGFAKMPEDGPLDDFMPKGSDQKPKPRPRTVIDDYDLKGLQVCLKELGLEFRYNVRSQRPQARRARPGASWGAVSDRGLAGLRDTIFDRFLKRVAPTTRLGPRKAWFSDARWKNSFLALLGENEVDPFRDHLAERCPPDQWDGTPRIGTFLRDCFGAPDDDLTQWCSRQLFVGPVVRAYRPGAQLKAMVILVGPQGIGKSPMLAELLPDPEWFSDSLEMSDGPKRMAEALQGRVIVEVAEMVGSTKADQNRLKAFISRRDDGGVRLAYRHNPEALPRRCIIVGTTNDPESLPNDPTGNTRFVIAECPRGRNVEAFTRPIRNQLWAEAHHRVIEDGDDGKLPRAFHEKQAARNERHRSRDSVFEDALDQCEKLARGTGTGLTLRAILKETGVISPARPVATLGDQRRLGAALTQHGWRKSRVRQDNTRKWVWKPGD